MAASRALDGLKAESLDGEDVARPLSLTLAGPVVCPACGHDLAAAREAELDAYPGL